MGRYLLTVAILIVPSAARLAADEASKPDKDEMQDTWAEVALEADGQKADMRTDGKVLFRIVFTADTFAWVFKRGIVKTGLEGAEGAWKIDPAASPRSIDVTFTKGDLKGQTWQGIYSLRGDKLKICFAKDGKGRPKAFVTKNNDGLLLFYLERE